MKKVVLKRVVESVAAAVAADPVADAAPVPVAVAAAPSPVEAPLVPEAGSDEEKAIALKALQGDADALFQMALITRPPRGLIDVAAHWARLAQTQALRDIADELGTLNEYIGAYDEPEQDDDGEDVGASRFADQITEGVLGAMEVLKEDIADGSLTALAALAPKGNG